MDIAKQIKTIIKARIYRKIIVEHLKETQVTYNEIEVISIVERNRNVKLTQLALLTGQRLSTLSRVVSSLDKKSLIKTTQNKSDARAMNITLSKKGAELLHTVRKKIEKNIKQKK